MDEVRAQVAAKLPFEPTVAAADKETLLPDVSTTLVKTPPTERDHDKAE